MRFLYNDLFFDDGGWLYRFDYNEYEFYLFAAADEYEELTLAFEEE